MSIRNILLLTLLTIYYCSLIDYKDSIFTEDFEKCEKASSKNYSSTTEQCTEITPTLIGTGDFESQCCRVTVSTDPFERVKVAFGENWKQEYMKYLGIDEEQLEEEIARQYSLAPKVNACFALLKKIRNVELYSFALGVYDGKINYNCGDGEENFDIKNFYPSNEEEKVYKDQIDCSVQSGEKNCYDKAYKLFSYNTQCCWCEENTIYNGGSAAGLSSSSERCSGYLTTEFKKKLKIVMDENINKNNTFTMKCSCLNKEGKRVNAFVNSVTKQITIN